MTRVASGAEEGVRVSVVVRSYGRLRALAELLEVLLAQDHDAFEVVVVEQTRNPSPWDVERLAPLFGDPRVRLLRRPPLGGPAARNTGVKAARGQIVILIDDDDLPLHDRWISEHEDHFFREPNLIGLTARHVRAPNERCPYPSWSFLLRRCMSYSWLKTPYTYARFDRDIRPVGWLHGTNASFRREKILEAGLWDETVASQDEHSLAFKLSRIIGDEEYLAFKATPSVLRRMNVDGGMAKRQGAVSRELRNQLQFLHRIVGTYYPLRFRAFYPLYIGYAWMRTLDWIWGDAHIGSGIRARLWVTGEGWARLIPELVKELRTPCRPTSDATNDEVATG